jgi:hypothetical protein
MVHQSIFRQFLWESFIDQKMRKKRTWGSLGPDLTGKIWSFMIVVVKLGGTRVKFLSYGIFRKSLAWWCLWIVCLTCTKFESLDSIWSDIWLKQRSVTHRVLSVVVVVVVVVVVLAQEWLMYLYNRTNFAVNDVNHMIVGCNYFRKEFFSWLTSVWTRRLYLILWEYSHVHYIFFSIDLSIEKLNSS